MTGFTPTTNAADFWQLDPNRRRVVNALGQEEDAPLDGENAGLVYRNGKYYAATPVNPAALAAYPRYAPLLEPLKRSGDLMQGPDGNWYLSTEGSGALSNVMERSADKSIWGKISEGLTNAPIILGGAGAGLAVGGAFPFIDAAGNAVESGTGLLSQLGIENPVSNLMHSSEIPTDQPWGANPRPDGMTLAPGAGDPSFTTDQLLAALNSGGGAITPAAAGASGAGWTSADLAAALNPYAGSMTMAPEFVGAQTAIGAGAAGTGNSILDALLSSRALPTALSSVASLGAGALNANAAGRAADAAAGATGDAIAEQRRQFDLTRADNAPFLSTGTAANSRLKQLLGLDPAYAGADAGSLTRKFSTADLNADPVYNSGLQFGLDEGRKGINARAIANGQYDSGATLKALTRYGNDYASTKGQDAFNRNQVEGSNIFNRYAGVSGAGQTAAGTVANAGQASTNAISNSLTDAGNARAAGIVGGASAWGSAAQGINNALNSYSSNQILEALLRDRENRGPTSVYVQG